MLIWLFRWISHPLGPCVLSDLTVETGTSMHQYGEPVYLPFCPDVPNGTSVRLPAAPSHPPFPYLLSLSRLVIL